MRESETGWYGWSALPGKVLWRSGLYCSGHSSLTRDGPPLVTNASHSPPLAHTYCSVIALHSPPLSYSSPLSHTKCHFPTHHHCHTTHHCPTLYTTVLLLTTASHLPPLPHTRHHCSALTTTGPHLAPLSHTKYRCPTPHHCPTLSTIAPCFTTTVPHSPALSNFSLLSTAAAVVKVQVSFTSSIYSIYKVFDTL